MRGQFDLMFAGSPEITSETLFGVISVQNTPVSRTLSSFTISSKS